MAKRPSFTKRIAYLGEWLLLKTLFTFFRLLPLDTASALGGKLGQWIGPKLKWHRIAHYNLTLAFPDWDDKKRTDTLHKMWNNLGRTFAETPWLGHPKLAARIEMDDASKALISSHRNEEQTSIFFGAHLANWELIPWLGHLQEMPITSIYRHLNNPYVEALYYRIRKRYCPDLHPKGKQGARMLLKTLRGRGQVGLLVDQKQNDGEMVEFFGQIAPTATAAAELALKFNAHVFPTRIIRKEGAHFIAEVTELKIPDTTTDALSLMRQINQQIEAWVTEHPEQWLWVHQRWGKLKELKTESGN